MIIDVILDRRDFESTKGVDYYDLENVDDFLSPRSLYDYAMNGGFDYLARALDCGDNADVQKALCRYIDENGYNQNIKSYILSKIWMVD